MPSTNAFFIWSAPNPCGMRFNIFSIQPDSTTISFLSPKQSLSTNDIPEDENVTEQAFEFAAQFRLDPAQLILKNVYTASNAPGNPDTLTNGTCGRGVLLSRKLGGVSFFANGNDVMEGFSIEFGSHGKIRSFSLVWPNLEPAQTSLSASPKEIIRYIREHRVMILPDNKPNYFGRVTTLAKARTFTITKITPYFTEGIFGEVPTSDRPPEFITPFAELEGIADFGNSNVTVRLLCPIISWT